MTRAVVAMTFVAATLAFPFSAHAAVDGHFCSSPGYFAYELYGRDGLRIGHNVFVVALPRSGPIPEAASVQIPLAEVRWMVCLANAIEFMSDQQVTIPLDGASRPGAVKTGSFDVAISPPAGPFETLGRYNKAARDPGAARIKLPGTAGFVVDIAGQNVPPSADPTIEICWVDVRSRLLRLDDGAREIESKELFKDLGARECTAAERPRVASPCKADSGRVAESISGVVTDVSKTLGNDRFQMELLPLDRNQTWKIVVHERGRAEDLAILTVPFHGPNDRYIDAISFRNVDNTGPFDASFNGPLWRREFIFSPEIGRSIDPRTVFDSPKLIDIIDVVGKYGRGTLDVLEYTLTSPKYGETPAFLSLKIAACLTWPK